ncbi:MAG TPA: MFS transporter, partial [Acidimicrobiales bacterium]
TMLLGLGMGNTFAPATDSIMGSLPREKAGVGSAMNDTTRQTGGAIGVAVLGSILASRYHAAVLRSAAARHVPGVVTNLLKGDVGSAITAVHAGKAGALAGTATTIARQGFVSAFHDAAALGAVAMLIAAVGVVVWLPARASDEERPVAVFTDAIEAGAPVLEPGFEVAVNG